MEEAKREECVKRETKEREFEDENMYTVLFTAGTALLMVGLKRVIMMLLIEQWRLWVFFILNLVLFAIFCTSMYSTSSGQNQESGNNVKVGKKNMEKNIESAAADVRVEACNRNNKLQRETSENEEVDMEDGDGDEAEPTRLSKEELNERVEAFIATFRQHLVLDARKGREAHFLSRQHKERRGSFIKVQKRAQSCVS